ncbi:bridging integrator 3 isoform X2 [Lathamus discolor]|uniref:bridging integrator 3 isoform X2 n=1 Tax=Lathamus discolor TaxID=678569 RepID=UPI0032B7326D
MLLPTPRSSPSPLQCFDATPVRRGFPPFSTVFHRFPPFSPIFSPLPRSPLPRDVTPRPDITFPCSSRPVAALPEGAERRLSGTSGTSGEGSHELDTIQDRAAQETDCTQDTMSKSAVKISSDLLSNPLCEQEPSFLEMVTAFDTAMKRMDSFNQEKVNQIQKTVIEPLKNWGMEGCDGSILLLCSKGEDLLHLSLHLDLTGHLNGRGRDTNDGAAGQERSGGEPHELVSPITGVCQSQPGSKLGHKPPQGAELGRWQHCPGGRFHLPPLWCWSSAQHRALPWCNSLLPAPLLAAIPSGRGCALKQLKSAAVAVPNVC